MAINDIANALMGFGAGVNGQGIQFLDEQRKQQQTSALAQLGQQLQAGQITPEQFIYGVAPYEPNALAKLALNKSGVDRPSAIQEYEYYSQLPDKQQQQYLNVKRANQLVNQGNQTSIIGPDGKPINVLPTNLSPSQAPDYVSDVEKRKKDVEQQIKLQNEQEEDIKEFNAKKQALDTLKQKVIELKNHPGLPGAVGLKGAFPSAPGSNAANAEALIESLTGRTLVDTLSTLKSQSPNGSSGFGSLTEKEGPKIEGYSASLNRKQALEQYKGQLNELAKASDNSLNLFRNYIKDRYGVDPLKSKDAMNGASQLKRPVDAGGGWSIKRID